MRSIRILAKALSSVVLASGTILSLAVLFLPMGSGSAGSGASAPASGATPIALACRPPDDPAVLERITVLTDDAGTVRVFRDGIEVEDAAERARLAALASKHLDRLVASAPSPAGLPHLAGQAPVPSL